MDHARVYARSGSEVRVPWEGCCGAQSKPAPSPAARVRHPAIQRPSFGWCGRVGHPPESDLTGSTTDTAYREYIFFAGRRIASRDSATPTPNVYFYYTDHLGSTTAITTATGMVCYQASFTPYGEEHTAQTTTCPQNYKFTGYERDLETGLDYAFARYYDSRLGRFMSADLLGGGVAEPQSLNRYAYVGNRPLNFIDPLGLEKCPAGMTEGPDGGCIIVVSTWFQPPPMPPSGYGGDPGGDNGGGDCGGAPCPPGYGGTGSPNFGGLVGRALNSLRNPDCAALFGGYRNAVASLASSSYNLYTSGQSNPYPIIDSNNWAALVANFNIPSQYGYTFPFRSKPGGITFFGNGFGGFSSGFASSPGDFTQMTGFFHELEHAAIHDAIHDAMIDSNPSADAVNINVKCTPQPMETQSAPVSGTLVPPL
jgi:RHS repeat-associated protein